MPCALLHYATRLNFGVRQHGEHRRMRELKAGFLAICCWQVASCSHAPAVPPPPEQPAVVVDNPACVSCGSALDPDQLAQITAQAIGGDPEAAFRLSAHYRSVDRPAESLDWEWRAAQAGQPVAQYNQWFRLRDRTACSDRLTALSWLERSAAAGFSGAQEELPRFQRATAPCNGQSGRGTSLLPNNAFKPKLHRYASHMAEGACHVPGYTLQFGLT